MIVDTDVLIWYLRGRPSAAEFLGSLGVIALSAVTYMELVQGMRNKAELQMLRRSLHRNDWKVIPIDPTICSRAMSYVEQHYLSRSLQMADALIAATCVELGETLATANVKHYRPIGELMVQRYDP